MKRLILALTLLISLGCTDERMTRDTLTKAGFTDIEVTGWAAFACSDDDTFTTAFIATNPTGQRVTGAVCCGFLKACTIRF